MRDDTSIILANDQQAPIALAPESLGKEAKDLWIRLDELAGATGFSLKAQGICRGDLCIPLSSLEQQAMLATEGEDQWLNYSALADTLDQPLVMDDTARVWSLGPVPALRKNSLELGLAPDFEILDRQGQAIRLSDFRGKKVLITTWASW